MNQRYRPVGIGDLEGSKSFRLRFDTEADALTYFNELGKDVSRWFSAKQASIAEDYANGNVYLNIVLRSGGEPHVSQFSALIVPVVTGAESRFADVTIVETDAAGSHGERLQDAVDFSVPELVKLPQGFFPSLVRLERKKEGADGEGDFSCLVSVEVAVRVIPLRSRFASSKVFPNGNLVYLGLGSPPTILALS